MGTYREHLEQFNATGLHIWEIICARELEISSIELTDEQFEIVMDFVYDWVMNSNIYPTELIGCIAIGLEQKCFTLADFSKFEGQIKITKKISEMMKLDEK